MSNELTDTERLDFILEGTCFNRMGRAGIDKAILAQRKPKDITPTEKHIGALVEHRVPGREWRGVSKLVNVDPASKWPYGIACPNSAAGWIGMKEARLYMGEIPCLMRPYTGTVEGEGPYLMRFRDGSIGFVPNSQWVSGERIESYCPLKLIEVE